MVASDTDTGAVTDADDGTRVDRWLWSVRATKTRGDATKACTGGHVQVNDRPVKAAHRVRVGDRVRLQTGPRVRDLEVVRTIDKRVGAAVAATCFVDHSPPPPEPTSRAAFGVRDAGAGRPTKRDRRQIDRTFGRRGSSR